MKYMEEVLREANTDFEIYYRQYCEENDIDLTDLNTKHATRVKGIFSNHTGITRAIESKRKNTKKFSRRPPAPLIRVDGENYLMWQINMIWISKTMMKLINL